MEKGWVIVVKWPPQSPDLSPRDFFLTGYVKGVVFVPPLPANIEEMKQQITAALETCVPSNFMADLRVPKFSLNDCTQSSKKTF